MTQKIIKIGKSAGVTIPKETLKEMRVKAGDRVVVKYDKKSRTLSIKPKIKVSEELIQWTDKFIEEYRPVLEALAKK